MDKNLVTLDSMENCSAGGSQSSASQLVYAEEPSVIFLAKPNIFEETTQPEQTKLVGVIHKLRNPIIDYSLGDHVIS